MNFVTYQIIEETSLQPKPINNESANHFADSPFHTTLPLHINPFPTPKIHAGHRQARHV